MCRPLCIMAASSEFGWPVRAERASGRHRKAPVSFPRLAGLSRRRPVADPHALEGKEASEEQIAVFEDDGAGAPHPFHLRLWSGNGHRAMGVPVFQSSAIYSYRPSRLLAKYTSPVAAETMGITASVLSTSRLIQRFSNDPLRLFQLSFWAPRGTGRVTPAVMALPQISGAGSG